MKTLLLLFFGSSALIAAPASFDGKPVSPHQVRVNGAVKLPADFDITPETTLAELIQACGGFDQRWGRIITVRRQVSEILRVDYVYSVNPIRDERKLMEFLQTIKLEKGDVVWVSEFLC